MIQYFANREMSRISDIGTDPLENKLFVNERPDEDWDKENIKIQNSTFAKIGFKESKFELCNLSFCTFIDCYFRYAEFSQVNFTGCVFINCNFERTTISRCNFQYAIFDNCFIPYSVIRSSLPEERENICADICKNLSLQCLKLGDTENYRSFLFRERLANERHHWLKMFYRSEVDKKGYYEGFTIIERIEGFLLCAVGKFSRYLWGYGEKLSVLIRNILLIIGGYALGYEALLKQTFPSKEFLANIDTSIYLSVTRFFLVDTDLLCQTSLPLWMMLSENIIGVIIMGFFIAALFRYVNRR